MTNSNKNHVFTRFAKAVSRAAGEPYSFVAGFVIILVWASLGPLCGFGDTWQLVINTGTTIVTFLMVFLIQNTQNRDSAMLHIKIDELIRAVEAADNSLLNLEELEEKELDLLRADYEKLADEARAVLEKKRKKGEEASM